MTRLVFLVAISSLQLLLLLAGLGAEDLWLDEVMSLNVARSSLPEMTGFFRALPEQHPVYYVVLRPWLSLGTSEAVLRLPSVVFALASLWALFFLAQRLFGRTVAGVTAALFALSPFYLYLGQEARMYTLLCFLVILNSHAFLVWQERRSRWTLAGYVTTAIVGSYTHVFFLFVLASQLGFVVLRDRGIRPGAVRLGAVQGLVGLAYLPWLLLVLSARGSQDWKGVEHIVFGIPYTILRFTIGYSEFLANAGWKEEVISLALGNLRILALAALTVAGLGITGLLHFRKAGERGLFAFCGLAGPMVLATAGSLLVVIMGERYLVVSFPFFVMLLAAGAVELLRGVGWRPVVGLGLLGAMSLVTGKSLWSYYRDEEFGKEAWSEVAELLRERRRAGDALVLYSGFIEPPLRYYYPEMDQVGRVLRSDQASVEDARAADRIWLVLSHASDGEDYVRRVAGSSHEVTSDEFYPYQSGVRVLLLEAWCRTPPNTWFVEDYSCFRDASEWREKRSPKYHLAPIKPERQYLDPDVPAAGLTRSLRFDFPDRTDAPGRCGDYTISREVKLPEPVPEVWVEAWVRFSPGFGTQAPADWGCTSAADLKLLFGHVAPDGSGRFEVKVGKHGLRWATGAPANQDITVPVLSSPYWDGRWHRVRAHWRLGRGDGALRLWLDGRLAFEGTALDTGVSTTIDALWLGGNLNQGPDRAMSYWWGRIQAWRDAPDWAAGMGATEPTTSSSQR